MASASSSHCARTRATWIALLATLFACSGGGGDARSGSADPNAGGDTNDTAPASTTPEAGPSSDSPPGDEGTIGDPVPMDDSGLDAGADGAVDKSKWFGAARCANSGLMLCDSFEGASLDTNKWTPEKNGANTISIDSTHHARGNKSLKLHMVGDTNFQYAWMYTTKIFPATHVFGRMFQKVEKLPTKNMHWTSIEMVGPLANGNTALLRFGGEYDNFMDNYVANGGEMGHFSKTPVPINQWTCIEWEYDNSNDTMRLWSDEQLVADIEVVSDPKWVHPKYQKIYVGWQNYQPNLVVPMNVWIDDVAMDSQRIGCAN